MHASRSANAYISHVFGKNEKGVSFLDQAEHLDLRAMVLNEVAASTPLLLIGSPGYDPRCDH